MIIVFKLFLTLAGLALLLGYAARRRERRIHPPLMAAGSALMMAGVIVLGVALYLGEGLRPALYLREWLGEESAAIMNAVHVGLGGLAVLGCLFQMLTGLLRHPWHSLFPRFLLPLLTFFFVGGMIGYY